MDDMKAAVLFIFFWVVFLFVLLTTPQKAKADAIYFGAWSKHVVGGEYNERHNLLAYEKNGWLFGTFKNSYYDQTQLIGYGKDFFTTENWNFRVYGGATYGYKSCLGREDDRAIICPALVPELTYTRYRLQPALIVFAEAVALSFKLEF